MKKGTVISALIALGFVLVIYFAVTENVAGNPHGADREAWLKEHKLTIERNKNPKEFCLDCHSKRGQTKENFCNSCHEKSGLGKVDINK
ncbi:MAG: hypothetical protein M0Z31_13885 [Clostridia bacterium]|nr:hypothetical protein [Clostridia bacterium]